MSSTTRGPALVSGATRGIGRACATTLAELGYPVFICARDESAVATTVKELREFVRIMQAGTEAEHVLHP